MIDPVEVVVDFAEYLSVGLYSELDFLGKEETMDARLVVSLKKIGRLVQDKIVQIEILVRDN